MNVLMVRRYMDVIHTENVERVVDREYGKHQGYDPNDTGGGYVSADDQLFGRCSLPRREH